MRVITGSARGRRLLELAGGETRPTADRVKEGVFNIIQFDIEGRRVLDLFAGTGAVSFELLSRECHTVTAVEKAPVQQKFIAKVAAELGAGNFRLIRGDAMRYIASAPASFDFVFADPPYDMEGFAGIPSAILSSGLLRPGALFTIEHSARHDFSTLPHFLEHRAYGSVNFSIFRIPENNENA